MCGATKGGVSLDGVDVAKEAIVQGVVLRDGEPVTTYCRIGERSAHTWFALTQLLGYPDVRNYDGSWTEWGNLVRAPVARGTDPGGAPR